MLHFVCQVIICTGAPRKNELLLYQAQAPSSSASLNGGADRLDKGCASQCIMILCPTIMRNHQWSRLAFRYGNNKLRIDETYLSNLRPKSFPSMRVPLLQSKWMAGPTANQCSSLLWSSPQGWGTDAATLTNDLATSFCLFISFRSQSSFNIEFKQAVTVQSFAALLWIKTQTKHQT